MANKRLDIVTQWHQFRKKHGLDKEPPIATQLYVLNLLKDEATMPRLQQDEATMPRLQQDEATMPRLQQDITEFESFDPKFIIKSMLTAHRVMRDKVKAGEMGLISIPIVTSVETTDRTNLFTNNLPFVEDLKILCSIFVTGGFQKIMNSSRNVGQVLRVLRGKYDILPNPRKSVYLPLKADIITLPRIAAAFPILTVVLFHQGLGKVPVQPSEIVGRDVEWPRAFLCCMMASMVPEIINKPVAQLLAVAVANRRNTKLIHLLRDLKASLQSTVIPNEVKLSGYRKWGLMVEEVEEFIPAIKDSAMDCKEYIRAQRPDDPDLESVLGELSEIDGGFVTRPSPEPAVNGHV